MNKIKITSELLAELKDKAQKATPEPWEQVCGVGIGQVDRFGIALGMPEPLGKMKYNRDAAYIAAASPDVVLAMIDRIERLEKEANWLAEHALCHSEIGTLSCPHTFRNITCKPFEEWRKEKDAEGSHSGFVLIDRATCMELGKSCWREAARRAVEEMKNA